MKITKLVCPSCRGTGLFKLLAAYGTRCMWCKGNKRLPVVDALRYADITYICAEGGYVVGDHDMEQMNLMRAEAESVYALAQVKPTWRAGKQ